MKIMMEIMAIGCEFEFDGRKIILLSLKLGCFEAIEWQKMCGSWKLSFVNGN